MLIGLTRAVASSLAHCEVTFIDRQLVDYDRAVRQHDRYCAALGRCGVCVKVLSADPSYPDSCFVEDTAVVLDELAVITSMGVASRRGETATIESALAEYRELAQIRPPATIEGGDVLRIGKTLFVGLSGRTNAQGVAELSRILKPRGYNVTPVGMKNSLHLKTACTAVDDETILVNPQWVELAPFQRYMTLSLPSDEPWAANTLRVEDTIFLQDGFPKTFELVRRHHEKVETLDISEFRKAEAGLTCLSLVFRGTL